MKSKLTEQKIKTLVPKSAPYEVHDSVLNGFLLRVQPSGVMTFYLSYRTKGGKKKRITIGRCGTASPAQARDVAKELLGQVLSGEDVQAKKQAAKHQAELAKERTLRGFIEYRYGPWAITERKSGAESIKRIHTVFAHLLEMDLAEINTWIAVKWRTEQRNAGKAKTTLNRDLAALRTCLSKAVEWDFLEVHPLAKLKPYKLDRIGRVRYLEPHEEISLRKALDSREHQMRRGRDSGNAWRRVRGYPEFIDLNRQTYVGHLKPMVLLSLNTGLRKGELFRLCWCDVNLQVKTLRVAGSNAKSGYTRYIPLNNEALKILSNLKSQEIHSEYVFPGKNRDLPITDVKKSWASVLSESGITNFRWHDMRHHFASRLAMSGVDLNTIRELLGHAELTMTLRYAHLSPDHKADAVAKLNIQ